MVAGRDDGGGGGGDGTGDGDARLPPRLELLAGVPGTCGLLDGDGAQARFQQPQGLAIDSAGYVYVGERFNRCVRRVELATGKTTSFAGMCGTSGNAVDGTDGIARFTEIGGLVLDEAAGTLFVADATDQTIRALTLADKSVTTIAGMPRTSGYAEGTGTAARFNFPMNLARDGATTFIADSMNHRIRALNGQTTTFVVGGGAGYGNTDDPSSTDVNEPVGVAVDAQYIYWSEPFGNIVRRMERSTQQVRFVAGTFSTGFTDGVGQAARLNHPVGVLDDGAGTLYIADRDNGAIRRVDTATLEVTTFVGTPGATGIVLGALPGNLVTPHTMALAATGELVIADRDQCALFVVRP
jgi:sugar lactone lactonase YvrE